MEADQPASSEIPPSVTGPPQQTETYRTRPQDASDICAAAMTDLCPAQSPLFNAEAAAQAARMAEALLTSTPPPEQPRMFTVTAAACSPQQSESRGNATEDERPSSGLPVPDEEAACSSLGCFPRKSSAADDTHTSSIKSPDPEQASHDEQAAEVSPGTRACQSSTAGLACPRNPAQQRGTGEGHTQGKAARVQVLTTAGSEGSPAPCAKELTQGSSQHRVATVRASLALQSRRVSRSGSAEAFERGKCGKDLIVTPALQH